MEYHLKPIEHFIRYYLKPRNSALENFDEKSLSDLLSIIDIELEKIKVFISESFHSFDEEKSSIYFIRNHQRRIITIVNQINNRPNLHINDPETRKLLLSELSIRLLELLTYLEQDFVHCLDLQLCVTRDYGSKMASDFLKVIADFDISFHRCDSLMDIALEPIHSFAQSNLTSYTYTQVNYLHRLIKEINRLSKTECLGVKSSLIDILFLINFNNNDFYKYVANMIQEDIEKQDDGHIKLQKLKLHLKHFKQKNSKRDIVFLPDRKNIKDQIVDWLTEEITYLESNLQSERSIMLEEPTEKFSLDLTADQLSLLIKIGAATKLIHIDELSKFTRFISRHFSTKKQADISPDSLRNRIYKTELKNPESIKSEFLKLLDKHL